MSNIKLKIIYNQEYDIQRVKEIINKIDWFNKNKYDYKKFSFPKLLDASKLGLYSEEEIKNAVIEEYNEDLYHDNEKFIIDNWLKISEELKLALSRSLLPIKEEYIIYLTKYGTGGSYDLPNIIYINISRAWMVGALKNIVHEIIHISIEKYIDEYVIEQWKKERIVDLFSMKNFPNRTRMQEMPIKTEEIDRVFEENFPNIENIIKKVSKLDYIYKSI